MKRRWRWGLHAVALAAGAAHIWLHRFVMNPDGVSYRDLAERVANGDVTAALNAYWSPLLPALLGAALRAVRPTPASEFPLAHAVNFALYAGAYAAFLRLVRELEHAVGDSGSDGSPHATISFGRQACYTGLFLWAALGLADPALVVPDLAALMIGLLAAAELLRVAAALVRHGWVAGGQVLAGQPRRWRGGGCNCRVADAPRSSADEPGSVDREHLRGVLGAARTRDLRGGDPAA